jgi:hypothetical protein
LLARVGEVPDLTLRGLAPELAAPGILVSHYAVWHLLIREGITFKKSLRAAMCDDLVELTRNPRPRDGDVGGERWHSRVQSSSTTRYVTGGFNELVSREVDRPSAASPCVDPKQPLVIHLKALPLQKQMQAR